MHRICKALLENRTEIEAVRFFQDPEPDYIGVDPDDLPTMSSRAIAPPPSSVHAGVV